MLWENQSSSSLQLPWLPCWRLLLLQMQAI